MTEPGHQAIPLQDIRSAFSSKPSQSENAWIDQIQRVFAERHCLDLAQKSSDAPRLQSNQLRINVDAYVAGRHFPWPSKTPELCGQRIMLAAISDLVVEAAIPEEFLLSVSLPKSINAQEQAAILSVFDGIAQVASQIGAVLVGGNLTVGDFSVHIIVTGAENPRRIDASNVKTRLQPGDYIWVSGTQGDAMMGLQLLEQLSEVQRQQIGAEDLDYLKARYWSPTLRAELAEKLHQIEYVKVVTDISDGWLRDCVFMTTSNSEECGIRINLDDIPRSRAWRNVVRDLANFPNVFKYAGYWGGDDYELAFATSDVTLQGVLVDLERMPVGVTCIGQVIEDPEICIIGKPIVEVPSGLGYDPYQA